MKLQQAFWDYKAIWGFRCLRRQSRSRLPLSEEVTRGFHFRRWTTANMKPLKASAIEDEAAWGFQYLRSSHLRLLLSKMTKPLNHLVRQRWPLQCEMMTQALWQPHNEVRVFFLFSPSIFFLFPLNQFLPLVGVFNIVCQHYQHNIETSSFSWRLRA